MSIQQLDEEKVILQNNVGIKCVIPQGAKGYTFGSIYVNDKLMEKPLLKGMMMFRNTADNTEYWLYASDCTQVSSSKAKFSGAGSIGEAIIKFEVTFETPADVKAVRITYDFSVDKNISDRQACLMYHTDFAHRWTCHMYPWVENSKFIERDPLSYVGIPSLFIYRDDLSMGMLWGIDPNSDYLNPTTWTKNFGLYFVDGVIPAQFRVGSVLEEGFTYHCPMQIVLTESKNREEMITDLVENWIKLNHYTVEPLFVRTNDEALNLFIKGRKKTTAWKPGKGYKLEEGAPESNFIYIGEQGLSAYFDYLLYEMSGEPIWRTRCFEQMDFILKGQITNPLDPNYGAIHTAYDLNDGIFESKDRGRNVGYKPDLNAHIARYMLLTWKRVKDHEGIDKQEWYNAAILAINWVLRQQNNDGGLPQKVYIKPVEVRYKESWMGSNQLNMGIETGEKSMSSASARTLPALQTIYKITGDPKYKHFMDELEHYTYDCVDGKFYYTGHHPDLPPFELEEASIWGIIEYWLNKYEETDDTKYLNRAKANAYLAFTWGCPKQLSWVKNPTQCASAEQQHYLQYSVYCYHNRKVECLKRLYEKTQNSLFNELYHRVLQNIYWTQVTDGDLMGGTYERICDPWLARPEDSDFNSLGTIYMNEQSLDCFLQIVEMYFTGRGLYFEVVNKVYPDGICYYSTDISKKKRVNLSVLPSMGTIDVSVNTWTTDSKKWNESASDSVSITTSHMVGDLKTTTWYCVYVDGSLYGTYQSNTKGIIKFTYTGSLSSPHTFEIKEREDEVK